MSNFAKDSLMGIALGLLVSGAIIAIYKVVEAFGG